MQSAKLFSIGALLIALVFISGCTTGTAVMPAAGGAYTITKGGRTGFTSLGALRKEAYAEVNRFAAERSLVAEIISVNEVPAGFARFPQVEVRFRLVSASARDRSRQAALTVTSNTSSDAMGNRTDSSTSISSGDGSDFYSELERLGVLKEKGLLTEEEFQREKARLMESRAARLKHP